MKFLAKDFLKRQDIEDFIRISVGDDSTQNRKDGHTIEGIEDDLKVLGLGKNSSVYGCRVVII